MKNHWLKMNKVKNVTLEELDDKTTLQKLAAGECTLDLCYEWQFVQNETPKEWSSVAPLKMVVATLGFHSLLTDSAYGMCKGAIFVSDGDELKWHDKSGKTFGMIDYDEGKVSIPEGMEENFIISYEYNYAENN